MTPLVVVWSITDFCDVGCKFCGYSRSLKRARQHADLDMVLAFGQILRQFQRHTGREVLVSWLGGEPFLWPHFLRALQVFQQEYGLRQGVTTSGPRQLEFRAWQKVVNNLDHITFSVDGLAEQHDHLRQTPGLFETVRARASALSQLKATTGRGPALRANVVLLRDNLTDFPRLCETLADWGIRTITYNALGGRDRPEFYPDHCLQPEHITQLREMLSALRGQLAERGVALLGNARYMERLTAWAHHQPIPIADCAPGQEFLYVTVDGIISPCSFTPTEYGTPICDLNTADDLIALPAHFATRRAARPLPVCADCPSTQVFGKFKME